jgi:hypothetical protein
MTFFITRHRRHHQRKSIEAGLQQEKTKEIKVDFHFFGGEIDSFWTSNKSETLGAFWIPRSINLAVLTSDMAYQTKHYW